MSATTLDSIVAAFPNRERADRALAALMKAGFAPDELGFVERAKVPDRGVVVTGAKPPKDYTPAQAGAAAGLAVGVTAGAAVGAAMLTGVIPVIGPVLAIGSLGTILLNAVGGAAIVGIAGALVGWGVSDEEARYFEAEVNSGKCLVSVKAKGREDEARLILQRYDGYDRLRPVSRETSID